MEQCPVCGTFMQFNMTYAYGNPVIYYTCPMCNYDTRDIRTTASSTTGPINHITPDTVDTSRWVPRLPRRNEVSGNG